MKQKYKKFDRYINTAEGYVLRKHQQNRSVREMSIYKRGVWLSNKRNKDGWHKRFKFGFD